MLKIHLINPPSLKNIHKKYFFAIDQVIRWSIDIQKAFNCFIYSVYLRGSVAHGSQNPYSDMDMVVLVKDIPFNSLKCIEDGIDSLLSVYLYPFIVDVKVYEVDNNNKINPASNISGSLRKKIKRHLNFDLYANGICVWGHKIRRDPLLYRTAKEFIESNKEIYGREIHLLLEEMENNKNFNGYYALIKKCIKLISLLYFKPEVGYFGTLKSSFLYAIENAQYIKDDLCELFNFIENDMHSNTEEELKKIQVLIKKVTCNILLH